jgi:hypothetical protein
MYYFSYASRFSELFRLIFCANTSHFPSLQCLLNAWPISWYDKRRYQNDSTKYRYPSLHAISLHAILISEFKKKHWPRVASSNDSDAESEFDNSGHDIVKLANWQTVGFEDVDETNEDELLESRSSELANEDLLEMENNLNDESQEPFLLIPSNSFQQNK